VKDLRGRLAQVLHLASRNAESAQEYLEGAERASPEQRLEFRRAAAEQLLFSGRVREGTEILHTVLEAVGMRAPRSPIAIVLLLVFYRIRLLVTPLRTPANVAAPATGGERLRVEALATVSTGFALVNVIMSACMTLKFMVEALRTGDRPQLVRAASLGMAMADSAGKPPDRRTLTLARFASELVAQENSDEARHYYQSCLGVGFYVRGQWKTAREVLVRIGHIRSRTGHHANAKIFAAYTLFWMAELDAAKLRMTELFAEAEDRGDLYTMVSLRTSNLLRCRLADDDPERAQREVDEAVEQWKTNSFSLQHWQAAVYGREIDLYVGDTAGAYDRLVEKMPQIRRSLLLNAGYVRAMTAFQLGRAAVASIATATTERRARIKVARKQVRHLAREYDGWTKVLCAVLEAIVENAAGRREHALAALRTAIEQAKATDTLVFLAPAQHRLGELLGGDEGAALVRRAREALAEQGVKNADRWMAMQMPGTWG
jgi:hypothetical protein